MSSPQIAPRIGIHHFPTVENKEYMSGTVDLYYNHKLYHEARTTWLLTGCDKWLEKMESHFDRTQYVIFKELGVASEMILLKDGLTLDWETEIEKGLDYLCVQHLWENAPSLDGAYRFGCGFTLHPLGRIFWRAPDLFYWNKNRQN